MDAGAVAVILVNRNAGQDVFMANKDKYSERCVPDFPGGVNVQGADESHTGRITPTWMTELSCSTGGHRYYTFEQRYNTLTRKQQCCMKYPPVCMITLEDGNFLEPLMESSPL